MTIKKIILGALAVTSLAFTSCSDDDNIPMDADLAINFSGLEALGSDFVYEGWIIVNGNPISSGRFSSIEFPQTFSVDRVSLEAATKFVLTIEPATEDAADLLAPSATKILAGDFSGNSATVNSDNTIVDSESTINTLADSMGKFILATPTDDDDTNEDSGVWFLANSAAGLELPILSAGWKYEGWVVLGGVPVSTGTFLMATGADDNASTSPYKGTAGDGPGFPGEDYVMGSAAGTTFPTSLKGATVVISVEPSPDNSPAPFTLKPLDFMVPADAETHSALTMGAGSVSVLTGTATR